MNQSASFFKLSPAESTAVTTDANPVLQGVRFDSITATMLAQDLAFYPGFRLVEITDRTAQPAPRRMVLHRPGQAIVLNWTNAPVYALNASGALRPRPGHGRRLRAVSSIRWCMASTAGSLSSMPSPTSPGTKTRRPPPANPSAAWYGRYR